MSKIPCGVLGATGMVGQYDITLLDNHPWFEVSYLAASPRSAGKRYKDAVEWKMQEPIPKQLEDLVVADANNVDEALGRCKFLFSALELDKEITRKLEEEYASKDIPIISNASAHRWTEDVPMLIAEINPDHIDIINYQRKNRGWNKGFIVVKPNCSIQSYMIPFHALREKGYEISDVVVFTMQAVSGAGSKGVPSMAITENVIPYIGGEEEKSEREPLKIFGVLKDGEFIYDNSMSISAHCNRVPVIHGHMADVSFGFRGEKPSIEEIIDIWKNYRSVPQELKLPSAPQNPIIYLREENRPQTRIDRDNGKGMAITVGRLREDPLAFLDYKFVGLSHNTVRGAAGGGILNAELLKVKGYL